MGALPIDHAAAHDNDAALEIMYVAYKQGSNDIERKAEFIKQFDSTCLHTSRRILLLV